MKVEVEGVTIAGGASLSSAVDLRSRVLRAIVFPSGWTSADVAFQVALEEGGTYSDFMDWDGTRWVTGGASGETSTVRQEAAQALAWTKLESVSTSDASTGVVQGNADLPAVITFDVSDFDFSGGSADLTFNLTVDGGTPQAVSITAATTDAAGFITALEADLDDTVVIDNTDTDTFTITTVSVGADATLELTDLVDEGPNTTLVDNTSETGTDQSAAKTVYLYTENRY